MNPADPPRRSSARCAATAAGLDIAGFLVQAVWLLMGSPNGVMGVSPMGRAVVRRL